MSQNVPVLAVLVLLCAPGRVWSGEPQFSNIPRIGSSYQGAGSGGIQDQNARSSSINLLPVYSISERRNAYGSAPETFHDSQSNHRREPQQMPSYIVRPSQTARFMTSLPRGISPPEIDGINPPGINSELKVSSANQMIPFLDATEQGVPSDPPLSRRGDPLNKIPIYVIRPPYSGMAIPTIVNLAVLPQEQINPEIIRILESLRLPQDRAPLVLLAGHYPSLTPDGQNNAESGINTMNLDNPLGVRHETIRGMIAPHTLSDEEIMKHEYLIHGRRPPIFPNIGRFTQVNVEPGILPLDYWLPNPEDPENIVPMNTERLVVPRGKNLPVGFLPSQLSTLPRIIVPNDYYPPAKDHVPAGFFGSQRYQPIPQAGIPEHLTQQPQFPNRFTPNLQQKPGYLGSPYPGQQNIYSGLYNQQAPNNFPIPSSPQFPSSDGRPPSVHNQPEVIPQMGRFIIPETPSQYPSMHPENLTGYPHTIPKQFYPGKQIKYPFIQKFPQDRVKHPSYPYPPDTEASNTPERSYPARKYIYPEYFTRDFEDLGNYPDLQHVNPSQSSHFTSQSPSPSGNIYRSSPQYPYINKQLPIQPRPNIHAEIEELIISDKQQQAPPHSYPQFSPASQHVPDYHSPSPNQYYPDQNLMYPSGRLVPSTHLSLPTPSYDDGKLNLLLTPEIISQIDKINIPDTNSLYPESQLSDYQAPQEDAQYPLTGTDEPTSNVNTLGLPSHEQLDSSSDDHLSKHPNNDTDGEPSNMEKFVMPEKLHPSTQQKYPQFPSENYEGPTKYTASPQKPHNGTHTDAPYDGLITHQPRQPMDDTGPQVEAGTDIVSNMEKFSIPEEQGYPTPLEKYPQFPSADYDVPTNYAGSGPQKPLKETHQDYPNYGRITHYPRQPIDGIEPQMEPIRTEVVTKVEKMSIPELPHLKPHHQKYAQAPSSDTDAPTFYTDSGTELPYRGIHPDFPYNGLINNYSKQPTDTTIPGLMPRNEVVSKMVKFIIPEQVNPIPKQTYPHAPSSDTNEPTYYLDSGRRQPYRGNHPDFPYDQVTDYSRHPMIDKEPQMRPRPDIFSNTEQISMLEQPDTMPQSKYWRIPFSYTDEPEYNSQSGPRQPYIGNHPDFQYDEEARGYPGQPMEDPEPLMRPKPDVLSTIDKYRIPNQPFPKPQLRLPLIPSSGTAQSMYYPESSPQQKHEGLHPDFSPHGRDAGYSQKPVDDFKYKWEPIPNFDAIIEKFYLPEKPDQYPKTYPPYPYHIPQPKMKPDHHLPVGGEKPDQDHSSSSPYRHHQHLPFPYSPKEQPARKYLDYPFKDIDFPPNPPQPRVTIDAEKVNRPDYPNLLPMHGYPQYPSAGDETPPQFLDYGLQYPPERHVPRDHESIPLIYSFDDQGFPKKQQQPDVHMRMERFEVTEPLGSSQADNQFQHFYTTSATFTTQQPQYYPSSNYPSQNSPQSHIDMPNNETKTDISIPIERESPSVASAYPFPTIEIPTVMQPHQDPLIHPNFIEPQTYGIDQYPDSLHYPGEAGLPQMRSISMPPSTSEDYPVDGYSLDGPRQPTHEHPTVHANVKEPQYYPQDQPNYHHGLTPGHRSPASSPAEEPNHLGKPTVYVYPVPRQQEIPLSYVPQIERTLSWPPQPEPLIHSPGTHDYQTPIDGRTRVYPQPDPYPYRTSPRVHQFGLQTTLEPPDGFPKDLSRSIPGQLKPHGSTAQSPGTDKHHELDQHTSIKGYVEEISPTPSIKTLHTTSIYSESMPSQSGVTRISPAGTTLHPLLLAEQTVISSTMSNPVEQQNPLSTTTIINLNPHEPNTFIPSGSVFEGMPDQRLGPQVPHSTQDILHTEHANGQESDLETVQPVGEPGSSVNTLDFPYSTEGMNEYTPVSSGSTIRPSEESERGFYPDEALTTTADTTGVGSTPNEPSIILPTLVPQVVSVRKQPEPSSGVTDLPTSSSISIESGSSSLPLDSPHLPKDPSLLPDSKITRLFPVTKPTFYTGKDGQKFVTLKLLNEQISTSPTGDIIPRELTDSPQNPGTTNLVIPIGQDVSDSLPQNTTQPHPMLEGIPISNVQVFDAHKIIKVIESCNCSNLKFLIPILKRPQSAIVVANSEYPGIAN